MKRRWVVTGACGQLGAYLMQTLADSGNQAEQVVGMGRRRCTRHGDVVRASLSEATRPGGLLDALRPTHLIHLAGVTSPTRAEADHQTAWELNVAVTSRLARWSADNGAWFAFTSSDVVWGGQSGRRWREDDVPAPRSHYARTKVAAEREVATLGGAIIRLSLMYGLPLCPRQTTWTRVMTAFASNTPVPACIDEYRTPITFADAAEAIVGLGRQQYRGVVHVAGPEIVTPYELFAGLATAHGWVARLRPIRRAELPGGLDRPANMAVDATRLRVLLPGFTVAPPPPGNRADVEPHALTDRALPLS